LTSGAQLFGQGTTLANGAKAVDGYQALAALDSNGDGVINSSDAAFNDLKVWVDTGNSNGSASGTLESLGQLGITQLNLNAQSSTQTNNGNIVGLVSRFNTASGGTGQMADVWFATETAGAASNASSVVTTSGSVLSASALSANVSGMAGAISGFNANVSGSGGATSVSLLSSGAGGAAGLSLSAQVASVSSALAQFKGSGVPSAAINAVSVNAVNAPNLSDHNGLMNPLLVPKTTK
jgi:hypothetical protein